METIKRLLRRSIERQFVVYRRERQVLSMPVLALVVLAICALWATVLAGIIGLCCGCTYRFEG
ncbi:MAG: DUF4342 domain-containing protein [Oscillospiraceae bacterium]|nr:DUF4342 domain-containing protein [Oscillospiraceae bacterium]